MKRRKRVLVSGMAVCLAATVTVASAATEHWNDNSAKTAISSEWSRWKNQWETVKNDYQQLSMAPGADATQMNYAWYSQTPEQAKIRISLSNDMTTTIANEADNSYAEEGTEFTGTSEEYKEIQGVTYYANKVTVTGLEEETTYYYQYYLNGQWSDVEHFTTGSTSDFSFLYVGDPQIGASSKQVPAESDTAQTAEIAARNSLKLLQIICRKMEVE